MHGAPLTLEVIVRGTYDGHFTESEARHGGKTSYDMGPTAVVESESSLTLVLTSRRTPPFSLGQITSCGLHPEDFQILVAKGVHAPAAAYSPVCNLLLRVNTPGSTSADMAHFVFEHRRSPLFPFEEI
jgi:microcystin degradation protein MlrC